MATTTHMGFFGFFTYDVFYIQNVIYSSKLDIFGQIRILVHHLEIL